ncbi:MAG TPA: hypothetical protein VL400_23070, partial [Polyangiaceae bacterium]|nr:hypothetical protein [Polyangiaceae bacterium]
VLGGGKGKKDEGKKAFIEALRLDKKAAPDPDYITSDIKAIYDDAKKAVESGGTGSGSGDTAPASEGPLTLVPIDQQKVNTPVPVYVSMDDDTAKKVTSMTLTYEPVGGGEAKEVELEKSGKAYRGNVPCTAVAKKGQLKLHIVAKDKKGKEVASLGSESDPLITKIVAELDGKAPSWPGFAPPEACAGGEGDGGGGGGEDTSGSSHRQCVDTSDCPSDEQCSANECLKKPKASDAGEGGEGGAAGSSSDDEEEDHARKNWFTLTFSPDFPLVSGENVCGFKDAYEGGTPKTAYDDSFVCARNADSENPPRYLGQPTLGQGNNVNFGFGLSTMRLMLGYDRILIAGLGIGARVGWAFNGTNLEFASFIPIHAEGRLSYTIGKNAFTTAVVRPWVFLNGGLAQIDTGVDVDVLEDGEKCGAADPSDVKSDCTAETADGVTQPRVQTLRAIKQAGLGFVGAGVGVSFVPTPVFEINVGLKFSVTVPIVVPVLSPEAGIGFGF